MLQNICVFQHLVKRKPDIFLVAVIRYRSCDIAYLTHAEKPRLCQYRHYSVSTFSPEEFREIFLAAHGDADLSGDPAEWFRDRTVNDSGRVERVTIGGVSVEGTEVRRLFSLRSACFTVDTGEEGVAFRVTGFGHGVGMSQYGAELLARQGKTWQEIIHWYYADVTIGAYKE
mgnify:FL=1